jgi:hypothetical protein
MTHEPDGVALEVEQLLSQAGQGVGELVRARVQRRTQELRDAVRDSAQRTAEVTTRVEAEKSTARAQLARTGRKEWWESASAEQIVDAVSTAEEWRGSDPEFAAAADRIRGEVKDRFGIDLDAYEPLQVTQSAQDNDMSSRASTGAEAEEISSALSDLRESMRVTALAGQSPMDEVVAAGQSAGSPKARRQRGLGGLDPERELGR